MTNERSFTAIDPLALIVSNAVYIHWTLPDPGPEQVKAVARTFAQRLNAGERRVAQESLRTLETVIKAIEGELKQGATEAEHAQVRAR